MNSHDIIGRDVISIAEGTKAGSVDGLYLDLSTRQVAGFSIATQGGRFGRGSEAAPTIATSAVRSLGPDALTVEAIDAAHAAWVGAAYGDVLALDELVGRPVVTEGGTEVGRVASVEFNAETFAVTAVAVTAGRGRGTTEIPIDRVVRFNPEAVVVSDEAGV